MNFDNNTLLVLLALVCLLPIIIALILGFFLVRFGRRQFDQFFSADISGLQARYDQLKAQNPNATREQLVNRIIQRQAFRCGVVGAITGLGGLITLPIALPIDVLLSLRIQATMVDFIAHVYGHDRVSDMEARVRTQLVMSGSGRATEATTQMILRFALRLVGKSLSKLIPFISAGISFAVNYAIVRAMGEVAERWYSGRSTAISNTN
jgi:uncharacterized protein (DUF697 family)